MFTNLTTTNPMMDGMLFLLTIGISLNHPNHHHRRQHLPHVDPNPPTQNRPIPVTLYYIGHFAEVMTVPIIEDINLGIVDQYLSITVRK